VTRHAALFVAAAFALAACGPGRSPERPDRGERGRLAAPRAARPVPPATSIAALKAVADAAAARADGRPGDEDAAVDLASALLRLGRVTGEASLAIGAERVARAALDRNADAYRPRRQLAAALAAQHRFVDAIREAERCRAMQPRDTSPLAVIAEASVELGDYTRAFDAVEAMLALLPDAAAYARASHLRQLQGDIDAAFRLMRMAADATSPGDAEAAAWHHARIGELLLDAGRARDARREFEHADHLFAGHPDARRGLGRALLAGGSVQDALATIEGLLASAPAPADHALAARALSRLGRTDEAGRQAKLAEAGWRSDAPDPVQLALWLVEQGRSAEAVAIAESAAATRRDVFMLDAFAWACFNDGQTSRAADLYEDIRVAGIVPAPIRRHMNAVTSAQAADGGRR